jgi:flagellar biosynthesis GTPase FlhF
VQIHRVRGSSLEEALLKAQSEHGDEAVVIQQEPAPGGGVTLSIARRTPAGAHGADPLSLPLVREVAQRLQRNGVSQALARVLCGAIAEWPDPAVHVMDRAAEAIGQRFQTVKLGKLERSTRVLAFVGLTGVGKTTTLVKLAARMLRAGRRVELATLDARRVGAVEQLRAWSTTLGVPLSVLRESTRPRAEAFEGAGVDAVLLDTTGHPLRDVAQLRALSQAFLGTRVVFDVWLVLSAGASRASLEMVTQSFAELVPAGLVVTKLDETKEPGVVLEHALARSLPIAFLSDGPDVSAHLHRGGPEACADLLLRGRLS